MTKSRHAWLVLAAVVIISGSLLLYKAAPFAGIVIGAGSGAVAVVVMAHLGVLTALIAPFAILRRRSRGRKM
jgi:hypothetical protein